MAQAGRKHLKRSGVFEATQEYTVLEVFAFEFEK